MRASSHAVLNYRRARWLALAIVVLAIVWLIAWLAARILIVSAPLDRADAIVVLSGSSTFVERTHLASQLYATGKFGSVLLTNDNQQSGWSRSLQRNPYFQERARWELERLGVPASAIESIPTPVTSTYDEAVVLREFAESRGFRSMLLVTSAYHSRRALRTFREVLAGTNILSGVAAAPPGWQTPRPATWLLSVQGWRMVPIEYVKIIYYQLPLWRHSNRLLSSCV